MKCGRGFGIGHYVGGAGRARFEEHLRAGRRIFTPIQTACVVDGVEPADPVGHPSVLLDTNFGHSRVLQVRVRIHEAGKQNPIKVALRI